MTDKQLALLLGCYLERLDREIDQVREKLAEAMKSWPDNCPRPSLLGADSSEDFPCLGPLAEFASSIEIDIDRLREDGP